MGTRLSKKNAQLLTDVDDSIIRGENLPLERFQLPVFQHLFQDKDKLFTIQEIFGDMETSRDSFINLDFTEFHPELTCNQNGLTLRESEIIFHSFETQFICKDRRRFQNSCSFFLFSHFLLALFVWFLTSVCLINNYSTVSTGNSQTNSTLSNSVK